MRILALTLLVGLATVRATTLVSISEDDQIRKAGTIFRGRVEQVDAAVETSGGSRAIVTTVRFTPIAVYKGTAGASVALRFMGGKVGDLQMKVRGMPLFNVGQEYVLFVSDEGNRACPVVGWAEGSLKVDRSADAAGTVAVTPDVVGAVEPSVVAKSRTVLVGDTVKLPDFEARLRSRIAQLQAKP